MKNTQFGIRKTENEIMIAKGIRTGNQAKSRY